MYRNIIGLTRDGQTDGQTEGQMKTDRQTSDTKFFIAGVQNVQKKVSAQSEEKEILRMWQYMSFGTPDI